jgi:hypothetical protein
MGWPALVVRQGPYPEIQINGTPVKEMLLENA